jgi:hypothetical protein
VGAGDVGEGPRARADSVSHEEGEGEAEVLVEGCHGPSSCQTTCLVFAVPPRAGVVAELAAIYRDRRAVLHKHCSPHGIPSIAFLAVVPQRFVPVKLAGRDGEQGSVVIIIVIGSSIREFQNGGPTKVNSPSSS